MIEFSDISISPEVSVAVNAQSFKLQGKVIQDGVIVADYTGDNALHIPAVFAALTESQRHVLFEQIAQQIIQFRSGVV